MFNDTEYHEARRQAREMLDGLPTDGGIYRHSFREDGTPYPPALAPKRPCPCASCCGAAYRLCKEDIEAFLGRRARRRAA